MLDVKEKNVARFIEEVHQCLERRINNIHGSEHYSRIERGNWLLYEICKKKDGTFNYYVNELNCKYDLNVTPDDIDYILRSLKLSNREKRMEVLQWAENLAELMKKALLSRSHADYEAFITLRKKKIIDAVWFRGRRLSTSQDRVATWMLFAKMPELDQYNDCKKLAMLGNGYAQYFFYDISDILADHCGAQGHIKKEDSMKLSIEQEKRKVMQLENMLERTNMSLDDLQNKFEEKIEESKAHEMVGFFTKLNSEKYGFLLDTILTNFKAVNALKREHFELPPKINGLPVMVQKLKEFIEDNGINPIMHPGKTIEVDLADVEKCDYDGTPFSNREERKTVRVISPGWVYAEKNLQIARPKVKEVTEDED